MNKVNKIKGLIAKGVMEENLTNKDLLQIIAECNDFANLATITNYAKSKGSDYNSVKWRIKNGKENFIVIGGKTFLPDNE